MPPNGCAEPRTTHFVHAEPPADAPCPALTRCTRLEFSFRCAVAQRNENMATPCSPSTALVMYQEVGEGLVVYHPDGKTDVRTDLSPKEVFAAAAHGAHCIDLALGRAWSRPSSAATSACACKENLHQQQHCHDHRVIMRLQFSILSLCVCSRSAVRL